MRPLYDETIISDIFFMTRKRCLSCIEGTPGTTLLLLKETETNKIVIKRFLFWNVVWNDLAKLGWILDAQAGGASVEPVSVLSSGMQQLSLDRSFLAIPPNPNHKHHKHHHQHHKRPMSVHSSASPRTRVHLVMPVYREIFFDDEMVILDAFLKDPRLNHQEDLCLLRTKFDLYLDQFFELKYSIISWEQKVAPLPPSLASDPRVLPRLLNSDASLLEFLSRSVKIRLEAPPPKIDKSGHDGMPDATIMKLIYFADQKEKMDEEERLHEDKRRRLEQRRLAFDLRQQHAAAPPPNAHAHAATQMRLGDIVARHSFPPLGVGQPIHRLGMVGGPSSADPASAYAKLAMPSPAYSLF